MREDVAGRALLDGGVGPPPNREAPLAEAGRHVLPFALGLSEHGVTHRSGADLGLGLSSDFSNKAVGFRGRLGLRASVTHLLGSGAPRSLDLLFSVGLLL